MIDDEKMKILKESSLKMYENTIKEMKERNLDTTEIEREYEATKKAYESEENGLEMSNNDIKNCERQQYSNYQGNMIDIIGEHYDFCGVLMDNLFTVRFFDVPKYLIRCVFFDDENTIRIGFYESNYFSVYDYLTRNKKSLKGTFSIEYLDKTGSLLRIDTYNLKSIRKIKQFPLDYTSNRPVYVEVEIKYNNHGITTK